MKNLASSNGVIPAASIAATGISTYELMRTLLPWASSHADPPISGRFVGAIAEGASGALYAGMNLEFPHQTLAHTIHAEGAATANAWLHDETGIISLAISAAPCGYCRHFVREFADPDKLVLIMPGQTATLAEALPFYPPKNADANPFHAYAELELAQPSTDSLLTAALSAARRSYGPYSGTRAGVALAMRDGAIFCGRYAENSAFNPVMPALQCALIALRLAGYSPIQIGRAVLVEVPGLASQRGAAATILAAVCGLDLSYFVAREVGANLGPAKRSNASQIRTE